MSKGEITIPLLKFRSLVFCQTTILAHLVTFFGYIS